MHGFIYEWTNLSNGLKYIGRHEGTPDDGYIGSGTTFRPEYDLNPSIFIRKLLWESSNTSSDEILNKEELFLDQIPDEELYRGSNRKYYNVVRNSRGYTSDNNPMNDRETIQRMMETRRAVGPMIGPYQYSVQKYGKEEFHKMNSVKMMGNTNGISNKGGTKTDSHKSKIADSIEKMYSIKRESGLSHVSLGGRPRAIDYSIIVTTVQQKGFKNAATEFKLSIAALKGRYYNAVKALRDR